jgi:hypothetical protein
MPSTIVPGKNPAIDTDPCYFRWALALSSGTKKKTGNPEAGLGSECHTVGTFLLILLELM